MIEMMIGIKGKLLEPLAFKVVFRSLFVGLTIEAGSTVKKHIVDPAKIVGLLQIDVPQVVEKTGIDPLQVDHTTINQQLQTEILDDLTPHLEDTVTSPLNPLITNHHRLLCSFSLETLS